MASIFARLVHLDHIQMTFEVQGHSSKLIGPRFRKLAVSSSPSKQGGNQTHTSLIINVLFFLLSPSSTSSNKNSNKILGSVFVLSYSTNGAIFARVYCAQKPIIFASNY